ncbi:Cytosolic Fe-S cluster assembly factor NARFL [Thelohanellus kitauei]|uniref:Cytosolic Fe-S cluster assembly factor NARFL n=1 Tax=Thelohanellus kitauei TaxID=669202 RepID=A0A0C2NKP5_THEKT|nr:Cytosolic Fe-S cluster assembly factor NARFL [Thelohanellus kitauei]
MHDWRQIIGRFRKTLDCFIVIMFSAGVKLVGVDDFIAPTKECIKPILGDGSNKPDMKSAINATLADCLACSGCITSAEEIFINQQGLNELNAFLEFNSKISDPKIVIFSISPQSLVVTMKKMGLSYEQAVLRVSSCLRHNFGVKYVFCTSVTQELSILESCHEFIELYQSVSDSSCELRLLLSGICPGWVCYAEKVQSDLILPYLSKIRSPQGIMGSFIKHYFAKIYKVSPEKIYHVSVQPCFDRKLEAYRPDMVIETPEGIHETDHVLSSYEFLEMMLHPAVKVYQPIGPEKALEIVGFDDAMNLGNYETEISVSQGNGSGGLALNVFIIACQRLFGLRATFSVGDDGGYDWNVDSQLYRVEGHKNRNDDYYEWKLINVPENRVLLKFGQIYGFKNIQNMIRTIKKLKADEPVTYLEVMACPGKGCLNGVGQISPNDRNSKNSVVAKAFIKDLESIYARFNRFPCESEQIYDFHRRLKDSQTKMDRIFYKLDKKDILTW